MPSMRSHLLVACALVACNTPVNNHDSVDGRPLREATTASPASATAATVRPPPLGVPAVVPAPIRAPLPDAIEGKIVLVSGSTLDLPAGAGAASPPTDLPAEVKRAQVWKFANESRLMMNELSLGGEACEAVLEREWSKMKAAEGDTDPERLKFRRVRSVDKLELGGRRAIFSVSTHETGTPGESASLATLILCTPLDYIVAMLATKNADAAAEAKAKLLTLINSYHPK